MKDAYIGPVQLAVLEALVEDFLEMDASGAIELTEWGGALAFIQVVRELRRGERE